MDPEEESENDENRLESPFPYSPISTDWAWLDIPANPEPVEE